MILLLNIKEKSFHVFCFLSFPVKECLSFFWMRPKIGFKNFNPYYRKNYIKHQGLYSKQYLYNRRGWAFVAGYTVEQHSRTRMYKYKN